MTDSAPVPAAQPVKRGPGCAGWTAIVVVAMVVLAGVLGAVGDDGTEEATEVGAIGVCKDFMEDKLRAPSTADYSEMKAVESSTPGTWVVTGAVDAENGFGAQVRNFVYCRVTWKGDGKGTWTTNTRTGIRLVDSRADLALLTASR